MCFTGAGKHINSLLNCFVIVFTQTISADCCRYAEILWRTLRSNHGTLVTALLKCLCFFVDLYTYFNFQSGMSECTGPQTVSSPGFVDQTLYYFHSCSIQFDVSIAATKLARADRRCPAPNSNSITILYIFANYCCCLNDD